MKYPSTRPYVVKCVPFYVHMIIRINLIYITPFRNSDKVLERCSPRISVCVRGQEAIRGPIDNSGEASRAFVSIVNKILDLIISRLRRKYHKYL